jgi:murein DD-endopeptidase MepM/ murein hydrolase activator NlpD
MLIAHSQSRIRVVPFLLLAALVMTADAHGRVAKPAVSWQPAKLVRGSPVLFEVNAPGAQAISGEWMGHKVTFFRKEDSKSWHALAAIPVETKAGNYELQVTENFAGGTRQVTKRISVAPASYPRIAAHVATKFTEPSTEQLKQISADKDLKQSVLSTETPERLWRGGFQPPVSLPISDIFGTERVFNGEVKSRHLGLDFAAPAGTPVRAINRGKVVLAQSLYFEGGFVIIDHGQGLVSLYLHLSDFQVKPGDEVDAGQVIASSGSSGRATGPHLHLAVRWQGVYLDPAVLLRLHIP